MEDFNSKQQFKSTSFPFPSMPFSTSNRTQSASVYVIYTYDVLNIFMYIYTANMSTVQLPFVGRPNGVLFDFTIQIIHVLLIGIKFYPILVVADMDPYAFVYLSASLYMAIIWTLKLFTKGFCSRTEAFVRRTLKKLSSDVGGQLSYKGSKLKNATKTVMGLFSEDPDPNEKYVEALKKGIPSVFKEYFGQYDKDDVANLLVTSNEDLVMTDENTLGYSTANRYYLEDMIRTTTSTTTTTTLSHGFRSSFKNRTRTAGAGFLEIISERNATSEMIINILENLPLYLTLSFLLARYIVLFFGQTTDWIFKKLTPRQGEDSGENFFNKYIDNIDGLSEETYNQIQMDVDIYLDNLSDVKHENSLTSEIEDRVNHNYNYIQNLITRIKFFDYKCSGARGRVRRTKLAKQVAEKVSWMWWFVETYVYKSVPHMKYSKQFINTYTVAFMVVYFFTLFGFRLSNLFGNTIVVTIELIYRFIFRGMIPTFNFEEHNFNAEFRMTCLFTSFVIAVQLLLSIRHFHYDLMKLHKGEKLIHRLADKYRDIVDIAKERNRQSSTITSDSLHFPGYMIAHLVYGYALLFIVFFCCTILIKLLFYFPKVLQTSSQIIIPLLILVALKLVVIQLATRIIFLREDGQRITNLTPYYTITYFNFFFDCFLGLIACMSRIWQTTIVSLLTLPRIDKSMFNRDSDIIMRRLDKGHLAYINYVRMEHWYNNAVVNGFCEMLIESILYSQIYKVKFEIQALHAVTIIKDPNDDRATIRFQKHPAPVDRQPMRVKSQQMTGATAPLKSNLSPPKYFSQSTSVTESSIPWRPSPSADMSLLRKTLSETNNMSEIKRSNPDFNYKSFLRLRNLFFLCLMLKSNPILRKFRHHYLVQKAKEDRILESVVKVGTFSESLNKKLGKILVKAKETITGSTNRISKLNVNDSSFFNSTDVAENESEESSLDFRFERNVERVEVVNLTVERRDATGARERQRRVSM